MVDHAFGSLGLHRVALSVFAFNERAIRAYERVGLRPSRAGRREAIWRDGRWWDEIHMSVLEPEWRARRWQAAGGRRAADAAGRRRSGARRPERAPARRDVAEEG